MAISGDQHLSRSFRLNAAEGLSSLRDDFDIKPVVRVKSSGRRCVLGRCHGAPGLIVRIGPHRRQFTSTRSWWSRQRITQSCCWRKRSSELGCIKQRVDEQADDDREREHGEDQFKHAQ